MHMATIPETLSIAIQHHQAGRLPEAEALYRQILETSPNHPDALHLLGVLAHQVGRHDVAVSCIGQAIALNPTCPEYQNNLGEVYRAQGKLEEAAAHYRQALVLKPAYAEACFNLALALQQEGRLEEAAAHYRQALALKPTYAEAYFNLALALQQQGKLAEAAEHYRQVVSFQPANAEAYNNLGGVLLKLGRLDESVAQYRRALALKPGSAGSYSNLGVVLQQQGRLDEAVDAYRQAVALQPAYAQAYSNLGNALRAQGRLKEAVEQFRRALALEPAYADAHSNLALALKEQGNLQEAMASYRQALAIIPDNPEIHSHLLFDLSYLQTAPETMAQAHRAWNDRHAHRVAHEMRPHANPPVLDRRLRVGYVSADFHAHPVGHFVEPLISAHNRTDVEVFCYASGGASDETTGRLRKASNVWRQITGMDDRTVAELIRADGIDILVDLSGHTSGNRLLVFARKPAPVQVTYLGSLTTTGLTTIDCRLTDRFLSPPSGSEWFSEELIRLPGCFVCYRPPEEAPLVTPLPASSRGEITFGSFNNMRKVTSEVVALWCRILQAVPRSRLVLKDRTLADLAQQARCRGLFTEHGVAADRVELLPRTSLAEYLVEYGRMDIGLDPFPYNGCTTTCDAMWMGVPVVTLAGAMSCGRFGVSLLSNLGLTHLIASTPDVYVKIAVELAQKRKMLAALRAELRPRMAASTLCDARTFAHGVEQAYRRAWKRWCRTHQ
ncbi:MAG: tetratricopeptide repeat protein [Nitrospirae bacterium]|nr:MAG: tetratricopeptide repeat protein [Nitrospirota bacterium]